MTWGDHTHLTCSQHSLEPHFPQCPCARMPDSFHSFTSAQVLVVNGSASKNIGAAMERKFEFFSRHGNTLINGLKHANQGFPINTLLKCMKMHQFWSLPSSDYQLSDVSARANGPSVTST